MSNTPDRCSQLRKLHDQLTNEVRLLRESVQRAQQEGVSTSIESLNTIKSLQSTLNTISLELKKCPPELAAATPAEEARSSLLRQVKSSLPAQRVRQWFPDSVQSDEEPRITDDIQ
ncbi:hypothetical protein KSF_010480 [Reticulibacter mediterranei]|uniref:Uncharacterized protein n=1 Tax=Reticulibacter mediterranei TaxID=2778369 RepID=A0A8J3N091_9CHLR|nr:hypothetical protein [Reticulibacter mediterranei]GHO91000.1 hypothetical protein KSF_010480 [Reticulibacter mediterranei]